MSKENIESFLEAVKSSAELQEKIAQAAAEGLAQVAAEYGKPFTAEEFLAATQPTEGELSEAQLEGVAGGTRSQPSAMAEIFATLLKTNGIRT